MELLYYLGHHKFRVTNRKAGSSGGKSNDWLFDRVVPSHRRSAPAFRAPHGRGHYAPAGKHRGAIQPHSRTDLGTADPGARSLHGRLERRLVRLGRSRPHHLGSDRRERGDHRDRPPARPREHADGGHLVVCPRGYGGRGGVHHDGEAGPSRLVRRRGDRPGGRSCRQPLHRASGPIGMSSPAARREEVSTAGEPSRSRWTALGVIAVAQLMIALDATIVSIALPSAQAALGASDADRQWVVTAYTLSFGGLLLLGGRISDFAGRKRAFLIGLAGFAVASMIGGAAPTFGVLVAARALQGAFAALLAPTALSLLAVTFTEPRERATAFAVYGSIAGSGAAIGMLVGGALTQYLSWRWCLYVNLPIALIAAVGGSMVLAPSKSRSRPSFDMLGALLVTGGLAALVYACTNVVAFGWSSLSVTGFLVGSALMLVLFVVRESRAANPLLPLRILADRNRSGAYITVGLGLAGMFGAFLFLTYYLQVVLRYPPLQAGLAFLPMSVASQAGSWLIASRLMPHVPPRALMAIKDRKST